MTTFSIKESIQHAYELSQPLLLIGETGTGKTTMVREFAQSKKLPFTRININGETTREDLLGKYQLRDGQTVWQDGALLHALKKGHIILLDEINAALPEVLLVLQSLLEIQNKRLGNLCLTENDGKTITPHKNARIYATMNPPSYAGTKELNEATLSRFMVVEVQPLLGEEAFALLKEKYSTIDTHFLKTCVAIMEKCYEKKKKTDITSNITFREIEQSIKIFEHTKDKEYALHIGVLAKITDEEDKETVKGVIKEIATLTFTEEKQYKSILGETKKITQKLEEEIAKIESIKSKIVALQS